MLVYIALLVGCLLLYKGGDWLLDGVIDFGAQLGWPKAITGLLLVSLGTSAPELFVSVGAALQGQGAIAAGNVIGSNIINIAIVLGLAASVSVLMVERVLQIQLMALVVISIVAMFMLTDGVVSRLEGLVLLLSICASFFFAYKFDQAPPLPTSSEKDRDRTSAESSTASEPSADANNTLGKSTLLTIGGIVTLLIGAEAMIWGGLALAERHEIPKAVVALTVTALGTSLPEIAATVVAVAKRETSLAVGNVIGSNMLNLGLVLGVSSLTVPLQDIDMRALSISFLLGLTILITALGVGLKRIPRTAGFILILSYAAYVVLLTN